MEKSKTERLHSLDSLRAIMMMLGLVLHSAATYSISVGDWPINDTSALNYSNDFIVGLIHSFRMPIFFLVAGFFGSMLFYERAPLKMIKNRITRLVYPFLVFLILLWPVMLLTFGYTQLVFDGSHHPFTEVKNIFSSPFAFIPRHTFHLWFLYYLIFVTILTVVIAFTINLFPRLKSEIIKKFKWLIQNPIRRLVFFPALIFALYFVSEITEVETSPFFFPNPISLIFYFAFYVIGWVLFKAKDVLSSFKRADWFCTCMGTVLFCSSFFFRDELNETMLMLISALMIWSFVFGITGLFIRYGSQHSAKMRYISDASYWVYLIHLPLTGIIPSLIVGLRIPGSFKFIIVLVITSFICFVSYHYMVRSTFIGKFLNGRKYE